MYAWALPSGLSFSSALARAPLVILRDPRRHIHRNRWIQIRPKPLRVAASLSQPPVDVGLSDAARRVKVLPLEVVQRIAAGAVITGFDSVVQELVENSIDAKATAISVDIDFVSNAVIVQDNGFGVSLEEGLADIAMCNATTKLRSLRELERGVTTLGFRGQALWAIAMTASSLSVSSRTREALGGTRVTFGRDGRPLLDSLSPVSMSCGTTVNVLGLPWSTSDTSTCRKVFKTCKDWLVRSSLCHPTVRFVLTRSGKEAWRSNAAGGNIDQARLRLLADIWKLSRSEFRGASRSVPSLGRIGVIVGLPSTVHSSSRSWITTGVNGRCVSMENLCSILCASCHVKRGRYPVVFVSIETDSSFIDWNVSPMKTMIRFKSEEIEKKILALVSALVSEALQGPLSMNNDATPQELVTEFPRGADGKTESLRSVVSLLSEKTEENDLDVRDPAQTPRNREEKHVLLFGARVIAQVLNTYILIEHSGGIMLIEQHVAEERILYERLVRSWRDTPFSRLETPLALPGNTRDEWIFVLTSLGFTVQESGAHLQGAETYDVCTVPPGMAHLPKSTLLSLVMKICGEGSTVEEACAYVSCRLAVKNGAPLDMVRMKRILQQLMGCSNPHTCPHGRPIFIELRTAELARLFGRSWTPERAGRHVTEKAEGGSSLAGRHRMSGTLKE